MPNISSNGMLGLNNAAGIGGMTWATGSGRAAKQLQVVKTAKTESVCLSAIDSLGGLCILELFNLRGSEFAKMLTVEIANGMWPTLFCFDVQASCSAGLLLTDYMDSASCKNLFTSIAFVKIKPLLDFKIRMTSLDVYPKEEASRMSGFAALQSLS